MAADDHQYPDPTVDVVTAAMRLAPLILAAREEGEQIRRVPPRVAKALAAAGLLQMFLPRSMGGPELDPLTVFSAIEEETSAGAPPLREPSLLAAARAGSARPPRAPRE